MNITKLIACSAFVLLGGCVTAPVVSPSIAFNYKTTNAGGVGIVQVFEMGGNTVVQIKNLQSKTPLFLGEGNVELKYKVMGETAVLSGIQRSFTVVNAGAWAQVTRQTDIEAATAAGKLPPTAPWDAKTITSSTLTDQQMRDQIAAMKSEIAQLQTRIAALKAEDPSLTVRTSAAPQPAAKPSYAQIASERESMTMRVTFANNSTEFEPRAALARKLLALADQAAEIAVTGYTDSAVVNPRSTELAKGRAIAARQFLISNGVEKAKIIVSYKPAGGFIADNTTKQGRDENRRVEIEMQ